jgi:hypothetical protein
MRSEAQELQQCKKRWPMSFAAKDPGVGGILKQFAKGGGEWGVKRRNCSKCKKRRTMKVRAERTPGGGGA